MTNFCPRKTRKGTKWKFFYSRIFADFAGGAVGGKDPPGRKGPPGKAGWKLRCAINLHAQYNQFTAFCKGFEFAGEGGG